VNAAAAGVVVYAGGNLRGYGKLVIVKHNDRFLSAYGNNQDVRVKEGDRVTSGQMLARVGTSGSDIEMLHFEIRLKGKPENPRKYLPTL
jgi:lipoprotein NlpD